MKTTKKIAVALVGFTGIALASMGTFAANTKTFIVHQAHKHNEALTGNFTGNHLNLLPFHFEKITAQVDLNTADGKVIKGEKKGNKSHDEIDEDDMNTFHGGALGFLWNFLDDSQLTQDQKDEIQVLQIKKQQDMAELLNKMISAQTDEEKENISNTMKEVNTNFLTNLKNYIPEEKFTEFESFLNELPERDMKAEKKKGRTIKEESVVQN